MCDLHLRQAVTQSNQTQKKDDLIKLEALVLTNYM